MGRPEGDLKKHLATAVETPSGDDRSNPHPFSFSASFASDCALGVAFPFFNFKEEVFR